VLSPTGPPPTIRTGISPVRSLAMLRTSVIEMSLARTPGAHQAGSWNGFLRLAGGALPIDLVPDDQTDACMNHLLLTYVEPIGYEFVGAHHQQI
jgi:hypothetical protein